METSEAWKKVDELKKHPELANTPGYEIAELREALDPACWFLLLMEQPQFSPPPRWWFGLRHRCDLPWAKLLAAQPQFEKYCHWEAVSRGELLTLAFLAPELFARKFPEARWYDLYAFLTERELAGVLRDAPQAAEKFDMEEVCKKLDPDLWLDVLAFQPQLEEYFDWATVEKRPSWGWDTLLCRQPQFANHCDFSLLRSDQVRRIRRKQPQLFGGDGQ